VHNGLLNRLIRHSLLHFTLLAFPSIDVRDNNDASANLSAREQEHVARMTGSSFFNMSNDNRKPNWYGHNVSSRQTPGVALTWDWKGCDCEAASEDWEIYGPYPSARPG
jgi:hypothetical protein